ncbi:hypothetical protein DPEC_G00356790 [Dallia pectoralis]|uniref:Uncharacterized protein n=1 Tax=Dallia pectoralis TaxID=75939 RepID=A0ACC2EZV7_DALPE|nr:hypothetical protein DPEC_G00356790 [Dallia pectoralis]
MDSGLRGMAGPYFLFASTLTPVRLPPSPFASHSDSKSPPSRPNLHHSLRNPGGPHREAAARQETRTQRDVQDKPCSSCGRWSHCRQPAVTKESSGKLTR